MQTVIVNRNSWHYKLATFLDHSWEDPRDNFCSYVRGLLKTVIGSAFILVIMAAAICGTALLVWAMGQSVAWLFACLAVGFYFEPALIIAAFGWLMLGAIAWKHYEPSAEPILENHPFVASAWRSVHDKTCFRLKLVDSD